MSASLGTSLSFPGKGKLNPSSPAIVIPLSSCDLFTSTRHIHLVPEPCSLSYWLFLSAALGLGRFRDSFCSDGAACAPPGSSAAAALSPSPSTLLPALPLLPVLPVGFPGGKPCPLSASFCFILAKECRFTLHSPPPPRD